jgi:hypothetical protein
MVLFFYLKPTQMGPIDRRRENPVSETCVLNKNRAMDNIQKRNNYICIVQYVPLKLI